MQIPLDKLQLPTHDLRATIDEDELDNLAASLASRGQLQSIGVRELSDGNYEVVYGARRTRAARLLKWDSIRAELVTANDETNTAADKLTENIQRQDLTPIEEGYGLLALIGDAEPDIRQLSRECGKSREWIRSRLDLVALPEILQQAVQNGTLSIGVALVFGSIQNPRAIEYFINQASLYGCTVDQARSWATQADAVVTGLNHVPQSDDELAAAIQQAEYIRTYAHCARCKEAFEQSTLAMLVLCRPCTSVIYNTYEGKPSTSTGKINGHINGETWQGDRPV